MNTALKLKTVLLLLFIIANARGQELTGFLEGEDPPGPAYVNAFEGLYVGNGQSTTLPGDGELLMFISHRFGKVNGGLYEMFGLDEATMRLGFDYGILPWLSTGFGRSTWEKTWDVKVKARILSQEKGASPINAVIFGQMTYNSVRNVMPPGKDNLTGRMSYSVQALLSGRIRIFSLQLAPVYLHTVYDPILAARADMLSLGTAFNLEITRRIDFTVEYYAALLKPDASVRNPLTIAVDLDTGGHLFQLVLGNSQGMFDKALLLHTTDSWTGGGVYFGFNLVRVFYP